MFFALKKKNLECIKKKYYENVICNNEWKYYTLIEKKKRYDSYENIKTKSINNRSIWNEMYEFNII